MFPEMIDRSTAAIEDSIAVRAKKFQRSPTASAANPLTAQLYVTGRGRSLNWTDREKTMLAILGAFAIAVLLIAAVYSRLGN
jgi:hypothetical protein